MKLHSLLVSPTRGRLIDSDFSCFPFSNASWLRCSHPLLASCFCFCHPNLPKSHTHSSRNPNLVTIPNSKLNTNLHSFIHILCSLWNWLPASVVLCPTPLHSILSRLPPINHFIQDCQFYEVSWGAQPKLMAWSLCFMKNLVCIWLSVSENILKINSLYLRQNPPF